MKDQLERIQLLGMNLALSTLMILIGILSFVASFLFLLTGWILPEKKWMEMFERFEAMYFITDEPQETG